MALKNILNLYNPFQIAKNWKKVNQNPYAFKKFEYNISKGIIICVALFIAYQIFNFIIHLKGRSGAMNLIMGGISLIVLVLIVMKLFSALGPMKKAIEHYEKYPETQTSKQVDVVKEVDDILKHFEEKEKKKQ